VGCVACIEESNVGLIEDFGKFTRVAYPGMNCLNCCTERIAGKLSLRVTQQKINVDTRSKDNVFVTITMAVQIKVAETISEFPKRRVKKIEMLEEEQEEEGVILSEGQITQRTPKDERILYNAFYKMDDPVAQILTYLEEYFRFHGMEYTLDEMFSVKNDMTYELQALLNEKMNPYGYIIMNILVLDIDPDSKVKDAMNDIIASEKQKRAQQSKAEAQKISTILAAEADARTRELAGEGIANARKAIISGLRESVESFKSAIPDTNPNQIMLSVLMTQYLDTVKEASMHCHNTIMMPSSPAQVSVMEDELRRVLMTGKPKNSKGKSKEQE